MRQEILHAFNTQQQQYKDAIAKGLDAAVENFNFDAEIAILANQQLQGLCEVVVKEVVQDIRFNIEFQMLCRQKLIETLEEYQKADKQRVAERKLKTR